MEKAENIDKEIVENQTENQTEPKVKDVKYAGFWVRLSAFMLDNMFFAIVMLIVLFVSGQINGNKTDIANTTVVVFDILVSVAVVLFWTLWHGRTPGKALLNIKIVSGKNNFGELTIWQSILRYIGYILIPMTLFLGALMIAWREDKRGLHDLLANTYVIYDL